VSIGELVDGKYTVASGEKRECNKMCKNCVGGTEDECVECKDTAERHDEEPYGTCYCKEGTYQDATSCLTCKNLCRTCGSKNFCHSCKENATLYETTGECLCNSGFERTANTDGVMTCEPKKIFPDCNAGQY